MKSTALLFALTYLAGCGREQTIDNMYMIVGSLTNNPIQTPYGALHDRDSNRENGSRVRYGRGTGSRASMEPTR
jgi:hypothetical protein